MIQFFIKKAKVNILMKSHLTIANSKTIIFIEEKRKQMKKRNLTGVQDVNIEEIELDGFL